LLVFDAVLVEKSYEFVPVRLAAMMLALARDIAPQRVQVRAADRKRTVAALPLEALRKPA